MAIPPRSPFSTASCLSVFLVAKLTCQFEVRWGETDLWVLPVSCLFSEFYSSMVPFYSRCPNRCWITVLANISSSRSWPFAFTKKRINSQMLTFHHLASEKKKQSQLFPPFSPLSQAPSCIYEWKASLLYPCRRNPQSSVSAECPWGAVKVLYVYDVPTLVVKSLWKPHLKDSNHQILGHLHQKKIAWKRKVDLKAPYVASEHFTLETRKLWSGPGSRRPGWFGFCGDQGNGDSRLSRSHS